MKDSGDDQTQRLDVPKQMARRPFAQQHRSIPQAAIQAIGTVPELKPWVPILFPQASQIRKSTVADCYLNRGATCMGQLYTLQ